MSDVVLTLKDLYAAKATLELMGRRAVAIEMSLDMLDYFRSLPAYPVKSDYTRVYGLPIRIADGEGVCRPIWE